MVNFLDRIKNIFRGSHSDNFPPPPPKFIVSEYSIKDAVFFSWLNNDFFYLRHLNPSLKYWQSVILAMSFAESELNQYERYYEKTMGYFSEGLLQLSYEDCKRYGYELDKSKDDIFNIKKNIELGMIILNRLVKNKGNFIFNDGNYWAVLQPKNKRHKIFMEKLKEYQNKQEA